MGQIGTKELATEASIAEGAEDYTLQSSVPLCIVQTGKHATFNSRKREGGYEKGSRTVGVRGTPDLREALGAVLQALSLAGFQVGVDLVAVALPQAQDVAHALRVRLELRPHRLQLGAVRLPARQHLRAHGEGQVSLPVHFCVFLLSFHVSHVHT